MSGLTGFEISAIAVVVVLGIIVAAMLLYLLRRLKKRREKLIGELSGTPELSQDRAFNRLAMARREAEVLAGQGVDVQRAQELIAEGQGAFDTHHYDQAYQSAQSAHEALVTARQRGGRSTGTPLPSRSNPVSTSRASPGPAAPRAPLVGAVPASPTPAEAEARPTIAKNQAESQFQIRLLTEEIAALSARRAKGPDGLQAADWKRQATDAFAKENYTEAFRLALKGRRTLGGSIESLPATPGASVGPTSAPSNGNGAAPDAEGAAESVASSERCPECGYPIIAGDGFCRGCGKPRVGATCPSCGAPRGAQEPFCGRCGSRFP